MSGKNRDLGDRLRMLGEIYHSANTWKNLHIISTCTKSHYKVNFWPTNWLNAVVTIPLFEVYWIAGYSDGFNDFFSNLNLSRFNNLIVYM